MINHIELELERLQSLPYKWWKNKNFEIPRTTPQFELSKDVDTTLRLDFETHDGLKNDLLKPKIKLLEEYVNLVDRGNRKPGTLNYIYAINTEILELILELNKSEEYNDEIRYEMVDIIIFITLLYKHLGYQFKYILDDMPYIKPKSITLRSLRNQDHLYPDYIIELFTFLIGSVDIGYLEKKIIFNNIREDHL